MPIYNNFQHYQFLDVLDALSLRIMVNENFEKQMNEKENDQVKPENPIKILKINFRAGLYVVNEKKQIL